MSVDLELIKAFYAESEEILERLDGDLLRMEATPEDMEIINSVFRGLHTIKGNSGFLSLTNMQSLAHSAETLLDKVRKKEMPVSPGLMEVVRSVFEDLKVMIFDQRNDVDSTEVIAAINGLLSGKIHEQPKERGAANTSLVAPSASASAAGHAKAATASFVRVDEAKVSKIISLVSELELLRYSLENVPEKMEAFGHQAQELQFELDLQVSKLSRLTRGLSSLVFGVRLVPVNHVFQRFPRVVKDLSNKLKKKIHLEILNGEAELDKAIVEAISDPMTHLILNSIDHGIEMPEDRVKAGKVPHGTIRLNSYVRGNFVFIEITDDGRGIDGEKVLRKAVEKGIVPADKAASFTESKKMALIFAPGFSTAEKVTELSGRGVGMDVVKSNINRLKGTVIIDSKVGQGTLIQLRFPMSIVVIFSLIVEINHTCCALPMDQVNESLDFTAEELQVAAPEGATDYIALYSLKSLLWGVSEKISERSTYHVLRFKDENSREMGFIIDEYLSIEEAIVQSVDSYIAALPGIQGATIRKDGSVGLVLNTESIVEHALKAKPIGYVKVQEKTEILDEPNEATINKLLGLTA